MLKRTHRPESGPPVARARRGAGATAGVTVVMRVTSAQHPDAGRGDRAAHRELRSVAEGVQHGVRERDDVGVLTRFASASSHVEQPSVPGISAASATPSV